MTKCEACAHARQEGHFGDTIPPRHMHCRSCHRTNRGSQRWGHCAGCHRTFSGTGSFDRHQETLKAKKSTLCSLDRDDIEGKGIKEWGTLVLRTDELGDYWVVPMDEERYENLEALRDKQEKAAK